MIDFYWGLRADKNILSFLQVLMPLGFRPSIDVAGNPPTPPQKVAIEFYYKVASI